MEEGSMGSWLQPTRQEKGGYGEKHGRLNSESSEILGKASPNSTPTQPTHKIDCDNNSTILLINKMWCK